MIAQTLHLFPEIYRFLCVDFTRKRVLTATILISSICLLLLLACFGSSDFGQNVENATNWLIAIQFLIITVYGSSGMGQSISSEISEKTWDFQRLTALSSWQIGLGKFLGTPLFAWFCTALFFVWSLVFWLFYSRLTLPEFLLLHLSLGAVAFLALAMSFLISAYGSTYKGTLASRVGGVVGVVFYLRIVFMIMDFRVVQVFRSEWLKTDKIFFGQNLSALEITLLFAVRFGLWALAGAIWKIGEDLLEPKKFWRCPAFLVFTAAYILGFPALTKEQREPMVVVVPLISFLVLCAYFERSGVDAWKSWLRKDLSFKDKLHRTPSWISGWMTVFATVLFLVITFSSTQDFKVMALILFAGRDLAILQWLRLGRSARPELMALMIVTLLYFVPFLLLWILGQVEFFYWVFPFDSTSLSVVSLLPPAIYAVAMIAALWQRHRKLLIRTMVS